MELTPDGIVPADKYGGNGHSKVDPNLSVPREDAEPPERLNDTSGKTGGSRGPQDDDDDGTPEYQGG